jgi:hypothetical protein
MLNIYGGENWTPNLDHPGLWKRAGINHWSVYRFDPNAKAADGSKGRFVESGQLNWDEMLCGSPFGATSC